MWKPFGGPNNTALRFSGPATFSIGNQRAAVLICYEQLLTWPILQSAVERPTIILGIANDYWCRGTRVPQAQLSCTRAWARLFSLPAITATNQ
jgi:apolipoprotein N-acyltransferase